MEGLTAKVCTSGGGITILKSCSVCTVHVHVQMSYSVCTVHVHVQMSCSVCTVHVHVQMSCSVWTTYVDTGPCTGSYVASMDL